MKKLKLYQCEKCEKTHKKGLKMTFIKFFLYKNSEDGFPTAVFMKDANSDIGYWYDKRERA